MPLFRSPLSKKCGNRCFTSDSGRLSNGLDIVQRLYLGFPENAFPGIGDSSSHEPEKHRFPQFLDKGERFSGNEARKGSGIPSRRQAPHQDTCPAYNIYTYKINSRQFGFMDSASVMSRNIESEARPSERRRST